MIYGFMKTYRSTFPVERMAIALGVTRSGFYSWQKRKPSERNRETMRLDVKIRSIYDSHRGRCGSPKITKDLHDQGHHFSRKRVARRMRIMGIKAKTVKKYRVTTDSKHSYPIAPNLLNRQFTVNEPNKVWVTDITYVKTRVGWRYLAVFIDLFSRIVVGWAVKDTLDASLVLDALQSAIWRRRPPAGLMVHSDRGVQYACDAFRTQLASKGFIQSMSRKGNCWDNAVAESFFHILKTELIYLSTLTDDIDTLKQIFEYIELYYNRKRRHSAIAYKTPAEWEFIKQCA